MNPLKRAALGIHHKLTRLRLKAGMARAGGQIPFLLYAGKVPAAGEKPSGGAVKLSYLAKSFPEQGLAGNILYLVSSALPRSAEAWAISARAKGIKVVLNQNGVAFPAWATPAEMKRLNKRNARVAALADHVIFQSKFCAQAFAEIVGVKPRASSLIYNPVDTSQFRPGGVRTIDILLMGSVSQPERILRALEAVALLKKRGRSLKLRIAGKLHWPNAEVELMGRLKSLGLTENVDWRGAYSQAEAPGLYQSARLLVHMQDKDASPTVPLEAMACGTRIIGIASGGMPELVPEALGSLLPVGQSWEKFNYPGSEELASAIEKVLTEEPGAEEVRAWVEESFSLQGFLRKHEQLFTGLLRG